MVTVRKRQSKARSTTAQSVESLVAKLGEGVVEFSFKPSLLIILTTPFLRMQDYRTPGAAVSFDTTYNISSDGLKLSLFVVSSLTLDSRFVPFLACIHRRLDADLYRRIFLRFFALFGLFGSSPSSFAGLTADFADAIKSGYVAAWSEHFTSTGLPLESGHSLRDDALQRLRLCKFHFLKGLDTFMKDGCAPKDTRNQIFDLARSLLEVASNHGNRSDAFRKAEKALFNSLARIDGYDSWHSWWVRDDSGSHWTCLFDVGERSTRHTLLDTTNPSESQHRVWKSDLGLSRVPGDAIKEVHKILQDIEGLYKRALSGYRVGTPRPPKRERDVSTKLDGAKPIRGVGRPRKIREVGQGPPKSHRGNLKAESEQKKPERSTSKKLVSKSFPLWEFHRNSCAWDSVLMILFMALHSQARVPESVVKPPDNVTRNVATSGPYVRSKLLELCERLAATWVDNKENVSKFLTVIRNEFRILMYPCLKLTEEVGMNGFVEVEAIMAEISRAMLCSDDKSYAPVDAISVQLLPTSDTGDSKSSISERFSRCDVDKRLRFVIFEFCVYAWGRIVRKSTKIFPILTCQWNWKALRETHFLSLAALNLVALTFARKWLLVTSVPFMLVPKC